MSEIRVKTKIVFEVEYSLNPDFYDTEDENRALDVEREYVCNDPGLIVELFEVDGTFDTSVEKVDDQAILQP